MIQLARLSLFAVLAFSSQLAFAGDPDFLWKLVGGNCVPNQRNLGKADPCDAVYFEKDSDKGYAVLKDINGPLHFLILPTTRISGIESPELLQDDSLNYVYKTWESRGFVDKERGAAVPPEELSLAINSQLGRSQNHLHVHISCIRSDVKAGVYAQLSNIGAKWNVLPGGLMGHDYLAKRISEKEFREKNTFKILAEAPGAQDHMNEFGLGVLPVKNSAGSYDFILITDRAVAEKSKGHVEEIQDHTCSQL